MLLKKYRKKKDFFYNQGYSKKEIKNEIYEHKIM